MANEQQKYSNQVKLGFIIAFATAILTTGGSWFITKYQLTHLREENLHEAKLRNYAACCQAYGKYRAAILEQAQRIMECEVANLFAGIKGATWQVIGTSNGIVNVAVGLPHIITEFSMRNADDLEIARRVREATAELQGNLLAAKGFFGDSICRQIGSYMHDRAYPESTLKILDYRVPLIAASKADDAGVSVNRLIEEIAMLNSKSIQEHPEWKKITSLLDAMQEELAKSR